MTDISTLIDQATRRELALRGSTVTRNPKTYDGPRPDAESSADRPTLRWPDSRSLIPKRCHHCGAGWANFEIDPPYGTFKHGRVTCLLCSRIVANLRDAGARWSPGQATRPMPPSLCAECGDRPPATHKSICNRCRSRHRREMERQRAGVTS